MVLTEIKREIDRLPDEEQRELLVYLSHQRELKDPDYLESLTKMLDDRSTECWVPLESLKKESDQSDC